MQDQSDLQKQLLEDFEYKDGTLYWKKKGRSRIMGKALGSHDKDGYLQMCYRYKTLRIHRLIFAMHHGYFPEIVDHIDGNIFNNKIDNLRGATFLQNNYNTGISKRNTTGVKGVCWKQKKQRYLASCKINGKAFELGYFKLIEDATKAIMEFREKHHGEFARHK